MSDWGSWNALLSHLASGTACEISGWNVSREEFRMWDIRVECRRSRIPDVRHPKKVERRKGYRLRVQGIGTPPSDDTERASLSGATPSGFPKRTHGALPYPNSFREKHTALAIITPRTIAYPIRICCPDHWLKCTSLATSFRQCATAHVSAAFWWCVRTPCPDTFCHEFQRTLLNLGLLWW